MVQKLDSFSKILIATGQINYMSASLSSLNSQLRSLPDPEGWNAEGVKDRDELLEDVVDRLGSIMEDIGNLINAQDCLCEIDQRVAKVPFEIIIHGKDEVEELYEEDAE